MVLSDNPILIVGQGIAGSLLAFELRKRGVPCKILDDGHRTASSLVAAGLYNPFILKRRKLSWKAEEFFPHSKQTFLELEPILGQKFIHDIGIIRRIHDVEEYNDWTSKEDDSAISKFLGPSVKSSDVQDIDAPHGYRSVPGAGYVDTEVFLSEARRLFKDEEILIEGVFEEGKVEVGDELAHKGERYAAIIVATGYRSREENRYFGELPFTPAKGHTMTIDCPQLQLEHIVSGPCFILPLGNARFRVGATYSWSNLNEDVEDQELEKLSESFRSMCKLPFKIIKSKAGVRPATKDRRPIIGASQLDERVQIFGGMGSRAIMCAPLLAEQYVDHLLEGTELWPEVDVSRFAGNQQNPV